MGTPWDCATEGYLVEWVPRFVPYHLDLVREMAFRAGERILVTRSGPGAEVLAVARAVGESGAVRATDPSQEMVRLCRDQVDRAGLKTPIECAVAEAGDPQGGPWDAVLCAFGLWQLGARADVLRAWAAALAANGKVGTLTFGPSDPGEPFQVLTACLRDLEPELALPDPHVDAAREPMSAMFDEAGLVMVRHTVVRHTLSFRSAEVFVRAMREASTWRRLWEELGDARMQRVAARFYERVGGPGASLSFDPPATIAIAALPGAGVESDHRPGVHAAG